MTMQPGEHRFWNVHGEDRLELVLTKIDDALEHVRTVERDDEHALFYVRMVLDGAVITHAMGSAALCLAAMREAWVVVAPVVEQRSYVGIELQYAGSRRWLYEVPR